jgi:sigma-B regulation protein RsbU (phosphoserine phosphatase)
MDVRLLAGVPLFKDLPSTELDHLAETLRIRDLPPDTLLFAEGDVGESFYIIIKGELEVFKAQDSEQERFIGVRGPGEFVGELSLISRDGRRTAGVRTRGATQLWEMTHADFDALLDRQPQFASKIVTVLGERLTVAHNASIRDLQEKNRQLQQAYDELKAAQAHIIEKERLERELQLAYEIQMGILPQTLPTLAGYDFGTRIVPARAVGGDFFEVIALDEDRIGFVVGDVADKGVPSAIFMAQTHAFLLAEASRGIDPAEVLRRVNRHLMKTNDAHLFVTVLYGILDRESSNFTYARAGHELPILTLVGSGVSTLPYGNGQLLGILDDPLIDEQTVTIPPGGTLLLYTDGMTDVRNSAGDLFGLDRLLSEMGSLTGIPAQEVCDRLLEKLKAYQGETAQDDDVTLVAVHANGNST